MKFEKSAPLEDMIINKKKKIYFVAYNCIKRNYCMKRGALSH